tara:strand:+ start:335 stop:544 length:210 start_codon:yes stop_codon:yes gene_type:complete
MMSNIKVYEEDISQAYFDAQDLKRTLEANKIDKYKRVHGGSDNEETTGDLIENILFHIENMYEQIQEKS